MPLIAALTGHAFGGGLELAAVADIRVAESGVKLGLPETGLGMAPGWSGTQPSCAGSARGVRRMALAGRMFTAEEALSLGLVDEVVPAGEGLPRAEALAADIAARGPVAVQIVKAMINAAEGEDRDAPIEGLAGALTATTQDLAEGVAAFREKRAAEVRRKIGGYSKAPILRLSSDLLARFPRGRMLGFDWTTLGFAPSRITLNEKGSTPDNGPRTSWLAPAGRRGAYENRRPRQRPLETAAGSTPAGE